MNPTPPAQPVIELDRVSMEFGSQRVLHNLTLGVERAQTLTVIGDSGCGKTVLLKLIISLLRPSSGRVLFAGRALDSLTERELNRLRLQFGFLFQGSALFDSLNV